MKHLLWISCAVFVLAAATLVSVRNLRGSQWRQGPCRTTQAPEAQALLSEEWARAHARLGH